MSRFIAALLASFFVIMPARGGIMAETTRVIYPADAREKSLMLVNTNDYPVIVQSWVDNGKGDPQAEEAPFIVLPSVFRLAPKAIQGLRILYNQEPLPTDRESVFWLNLYEIPPLSEKANDSRRLMLAMNTQMKIFYRPKGLTVHLEEAVSKLVFRFRHNGQAGYIECENPTPLHVSFTSIALIEGATARQVESQPDMMTPPLSKKAYALHGVTQVAAGSAVRFRYLDDTGTQQTREATLSGTY